MNPQQTPYQAHLFVCSNRRENQPHNPGCGAKGGGLLKDRLKEAVKARGWKGRVRVSSSGCLGLCAQGPNVLIYPQGVWFAGVTEADLDAVLDCVAQHLA